MIVLGIDPGLANMGMALFDVNPDSEKLLSIAIATTKKDRDVATNTDHIRRLREMVRALDEFADAHLVRVICAEGMAFARDASSAAMMAMSWGVLAAFAERKRAPILVVYPQAIKRALGVSMAKRDGQSPDQHKRESKEAVREALARFYPDVGRYLSQLTVAQREHPGDAVGAYHALRDTVRSHAR